MQILRIAGLGYLRRVLLPVADSLLSFSSGSFRTGRTSGWAFVLSLASYGVSALCLLTLHVSWVHFLSISSLSPFLSLLSLPSA